MKLFTLSANALATLRGISKLKAAEAKGISEYLAVNLENLTSPSIARDFVAISPPPNFDPDEAFNWLDSLIPLIFDVLPRATDAGDLIDGIITSTQRAAAKTPEGELSGAALKKLHANLLAIIDNAKTRLKAKSLALLNAHDKVLSSCEILSDVRPIFQVDGDVKVEAAVVYHTLRIEHSGSDSQFSVALDSRDLLILQKAVERAIQKEEALSSFISKAQVEQIKIS